MSTTKIVVVSCNLCSATALPETLIVKDAIHLEHPVDTVPEARRQAHVKGWVHDKLGRDICPACRTFPTQRRGKIHIPHPNWR